MPRRRLGALLVTALLATPSLALGDDFYYRQGSCSGGNGLSYWTAWCSPSDIDWSRIHGGDTLFVCGTSTARFDVPAAANHGRLSLPITISGACSVRGSTNDGVLNVPIGASTFAFRLMRRNHYRIEHLRIENGAMLLLDATNTVLYDVEIEDTPRMPAGATPTAAVVDRSVSTTYDHVHIVDPGRHAIDQSFRGQNPHVVPALPSSTLWPLNVTFLTKPDFQQRATRTTIVDSYFEGGGFNDLLLRESTVKLQWNKEVLIERTTFRNVGTSAIEVATGDRYELYALRPGGTAACASYCPTQTGWSCDAADQCLHLASDPTAGLDAYDAGAVLLPEVIIRDNVLTNETAQCELAIGRDCDASDPCPLGYACQSNVCVLNDGRCADSHYGIVVQSGHPIRGTMTIANNEIAGFAGNGILLETRWEATSPSGTSIALIGNDIHDNWLWGVWLSNHSTTHPTGRAEVRDNHFVRNGRDLAGLNQGGGLQINGATSGVDITNNFFSHNGRPGALADRKIGGLAIAQACLQCSQQGALTSPRDISVTNNTFYNNEVANLMTHYETTLNGTVLPVQNVTVRRNISVQSRSSRTVDAVVSWRNFIAPAAQAPLQSVDEFSYLDENLYYRGPYAFTAASYRVLTNVYRGLSAYRSANFGHEGASFEVDPQLDANLIPAASAATGYGAR
ncbi:MAG: right-handed parallel beta-helix repeat-containing protein [Deltaproteobacteria bacterium]